MKNISLIFVVLFSLSLSNCIPDVIVETDVDIGYKNNIGEDLLDTATQNHFSVSSIHVYNVVKDIKNENHDLIVYNNESLNQYFLKVFLEFDTTLLKLNELDTDTITCVIDRSHHDTIIRKVWYNGILKWDDRRVPRSFTILK
ncbi:MAG: hypothetical protein ABSA76_06345 [Bacteroidales bacterium]